SVAVNGVLTFSSSVSLLPSPMVGMKISGDGRFLAVSHQASVSVFTISAVNGSLTAVAGSPFAKGGTGLVGGVEFNCDGTLLYAADDAFGLAVFNIVPGVVPTLVGDTAITGAGQIQGVAAYPSRSCAHTDFSVTQTASPNPVTAGNQLTYTITVTNNGPSTASV